MNKRALIELIERKRGTSSYNSWTIGISGTPYTRKRTHEQEGKNVSRWEHWLADSKSIAQEVEAYFLEKGMDGHPGGDVIEPTYVYVF